MIRELKKTPMRSRRKWPIKYILAFFVLIILLFSNNFLYQYSFGFLGSKISLFFSNLELIISSAGSNQKIDDLVRENQRLLSENASLKEKSQMREITQKKEEVVRDFNVEEAEVIGRENFFSTPILLINKGLVQKVKPGMVAIDELGAMVGKVKESSQKMSYVILTPNIESRIGAFVAGTEVGGILEGNKNLRAVLEMLPIESKVEANQEVVTDNSNPDIPAGLLLGKITEAKESSDHLFKEAVLSLPWESQKIRKVWIITARK